MGQGKTLNQLDPGILTLAHLIGIAHPVTGEMVYIPASALLTAALGITPSTPFVDVAQMLANTTIRQNFFAYVGDVTGVTGSPGRGLFLYLGPNTNEGRVEIANYWLVATDGSTSAASGTWVHRGNWDMTANTFPDTPTFENIKAFNTFYIDEAGTAVDFGYGPEEVPVGSIIVALEDSPAQNGTKWRLL